MRVESVSSLTTLSRCSLDWRVCGGGGSFESLTACMLEVGLIDVF